MKDPEFRHTLMRFLCASAIAAAVTVAAESPEPGTTRSRSSRGRPQVIYHLPPASNFAATLHSQAKSQNNELPLDSSMPASGQTIHPNANVPVAEQPAAVPRQERILKPRSRSVRPHSFAKSASHGNGHGNHPHKK